MRTLLLTALLLAPTSGCHSGAVAPTPERQPERTGPTAADVDPTVAAAPVPTEVVAASLRRVAELDGALTSDVAFGRGGRWWHYDGQVVTAYRDAEALGTVTIEELLAANPRVAPGRPMVLDTRMLTPSGVRPLPPGVLDGLRPDMSPHGSYEITDIAWSPDASQVLVSQRWRPSACCRWEELEPHRPRTDRVMSYDTTTGEHVEIAIRGPSAIAGDRIVVGRSFYVRDPLHALITPAAERYGASPAAMAIDPTGTLVAWSEADATLRLLRASDGTLLRSWPGSGHDFALAFHPTRPLLAVAQIDELELWRVDTEAPQRLAAVPLLPKAEQLVFSPDGDRLIATGTAATLYELQLREQPVAPGPRPLERDLALPPDPALAWRVGPADGGIRVDALTVGEAEVYAYGRDVGLFTFDRDDGTPRDSWRRERDDGRLTTAASRAPIFAFVDNERLRDPEAHAQRVEIVDASAPKLVHTRFIDEGEIGHLVLSPRGDAFAWSIVDQPIVTLQASDGGALLRVQAETNQVEAVAISDDGQRLAVANRHVSRNVFVGTVGREDAVVITTPRGVEQLCFSPDGSRLYVSDFDGKIHVTDPTTAKVLGELDPGFGDGVYAMTVTADGTRLLAARVEVAVLDVATGSIVGRVGGTEMLSSLAVSADGTVIVAGTEDGLVRRFAMP